jgi:hypothetical protein
MLHSRITTKGKASPTLTRFIAFVRAVTAVLAYYLFFFLVSTSLAYY